MDSTASARIVVRPRRCDTAMVSRSFVFVLLAVFLLIAFVATPTGAAHRRLYDDDEDDGHAAARVTPTAAGNAGNTNTAQAPPKKGSLSVDEDEDFPFDHTIDASKPDAASAQHERVPLKWENYYLELAALVVAAVYLVNYVIGASSNNRISRYWYQSMRELFASQFSALSAFTESSGAGEVFLRDSADGFKFYASGRRNCAGVLATLQLQSRQCLFATVLSFFGVGTLRDSVLLEFPLDTLEPIVYCLARKREEERCRKSCTDLDLYAPKSSAQCRGLVRANDKLNGAPLFPHCVMTDAGGVELDDDSNSSSAIDSRVYAAICKHADLFAVLHVSDQYAPGERDLEFADLNSPAALAAAVPRKMLRCKFYLPRDLSGGAQAAGVASLVELTKMALHLVDALSTMKLSLPTLNRAREARAAVAKRAQKTAAQKAQEIAAKKREEKRARDAELVEHMTPEQRRKHEEREAKERTKKMMPKVRMMR